MRSRSTRVADCRVKTTPRTAKGGYVELDGEQFYRITAYDSLDPFFISVVSDSNHWLFISSNGALTAGRRNPENALFPYETDDKIHDAHDRTGSKTIVRVEDGEGDAIWEPFSNRYAGLYDTERFLYKNIAGNKLVFEEVNHTLKLSFRYAWLVSDRFGFVRRSRLTNLSHAPARIRLLDGLQNLLPAQVDRGMQTGFSTLVDAYKKSELLPRTGIGVYSLSSIPVDRAEPSESLIANTVWSTGLAGPRHLLSTRQLEAFRRGEGINQEENIRGSRGAFLVQSELEIKANNHVEWFLVAEVNQQQSDVAELEKLITSGDRLVDRLLSDVKEGSERLNQIVADADGLQVSGNPLQTARHFSNTLFNVMRGGIFDHDYQINRHDLCDYIRSANKPVAHKHDNFLESLPDQFTYGEGISLFQKEANPDIERLYFEYLPLTFSRRHGDPSRPWNQFSIETRNADGSKRLSYQGNWRDIFQNWEALSVSYPEFIEGMIFKFVNASTADGYNPYRITRNGIEWEVHDPSDPWSNIGYWGDHQIIYLLKLLERSDAYHPGRLQSFLGKPIFVYAHVPYLIKSYENLLSNPRDSIEFDQPSHDLLTARAADVGSDGKLLHRENKDLVRVNLTEKLLVPLLAKLTNFIPEAGIWMNTQRPEWNDANNALVGYGVSMVTLYHLRRYLAFCTRFFSQATESAFEISSQVTTQFSGIHRALHDHQDRITQGFDPRTRSALVDALGNAGSRYRASLYSDGLTGQTSELTTSDLLNFLELATKHLDQSITANRRNDGLYHSYNLMRVDADGGISIRHLPEMLEGQVAVLSSGKLDVPASLELLTALRASALYREDQHSYLLYPDRDLPRFMEKNIIPENLVAASPLLQQMLEQGDSRIVVKDAAGHVRFNPSFRNADLLAQAIDSLESCPANERDHLLAAYEAVFDHQSFTGRSGAFFKYEGLGCIYWHMVSKLLLAVQDLCIEARASGEDSQHVNLLIERYRDIQRGIGAYKSVTEQGAFPTDPYSHTPSMMGAQQPGLTGQVKEDFIVRMTELGLRIESGCLRFDPFLLARTEFLSEPARFQDISLPPGSLAATICKVPVVIQQAEEERIRIVTHDGQITELDGLSLDPSLSEALFTRSGAIKRIEVSILQ